MNFKVYQMQAYGLVFTLHFLKLSTGKVFAKILANKYTEETKLDTIADKTYHFSKNIDY